MAFVKFSRGLTSTYQSLSKKDPDTLYLIYDNANSEVGSLYLGNKLISSVGNVNNLSLNDLTDITINSDDLADGMVLFYNDSTGQGRWEAGFISDIIQDLPQSSNISIEENLNNIENAKDKDIAVIGQDVYIYTDDGWRQLTNSALEERVNELEEKVGQPEDTENHIPATGLYKDIADLRNEVYTKTEIAEYIANLSHLKYQKVNSVNDINVNDDAAATTIYLVPKTKSESNNDYDEYFVVDGLLEKIGSLEIDLSNYVTNDDSRLLDSDQKKKLDSLGLDENDHATIQASQVGGLVQAIQDNQLIKSVDVGTFEVTPDGELQLKTVPSIDLSDYVKTDIFNATVGNLASLNDRVSNNSTLVDEINTIKMSIVWQELSQSNNGE